MAEALYFEDVTVGMSVESPGRTLTETDLLQYVGLTGDWESPASDAKAARLPDFLPFCVSSGLTWRLPQPPLAILAFRGFEWKFLHSVRVGDTIRCRARAEAKRAAPDGGVVVETREILNQRNEVVQSGRVTYLVARRPSP
jgi:acyl dehydratase